MAPDRLLRDTPTRSADRSLIVRIPPFRSGVILGTFPLPGLPLMAEQTGRWRRE
jgi:hypothetical protein